MKDNKFTKIGITIIVIVGLGLLIWSTMKKPEVENTQILNQTSREVALLCTTDMATEFHIHPELTILINGENIVIPANIGIVDGCMHSLHTHDSTGILHVEAPVKKDFTLSDFFAVWEKPFDENHILNYTTDANSKITMTINGQIVDTFENTILKDHDKIVIRYDTIKK